MKICSEKIHVWFCKKGMVTMTTCNANLKNGLYLQIQLNISVVANLNWYQIKA